MPSKSSMPGIPGSLALCRMPPASTRKRAESRSPRLVVTCQRTRLLVPLGPGDVGLEEGVRVEVERAGQQLGVLEDLRGAGVVLGRHEARLLEERQVDVGLDVAHAARVPVPVPGAAEVARLLDDPDVGDPVLAEVDRREHPGEAAAHDDHGRLLDHRVPGEAGLDERVPVQLLAQLTPLGHALGAEALLLLPPVALPQLVDRGTLCAVLRLHHHRLPCGPHLPARVRLDGVDPDTLGGGSRIPGGAVGGQVQSADVMPRAVPALLTCLGNRRSWSAGRPHRGTW